MNLSVDTKVKNSGTITADGKDYTVEFPMSAIIALETKLGVQPDENGPPLRSFAWWWSVPAKHMPEVLKAGLVLHHPDLAPDFAEAICEALDLGTQNVLRVELCRLNFPELMRRWDEARKAGAASPNVSSADAA